jgi:hypothetical protein
MPLGGLREVAHARESAVYFLINEQAGSGGPNAWSPEMCVRIL